jgi:hypothetical protein
MKPNYEIVKELITKHVKVGKLTDTLSDAGVEIPLLHCLDLVDIAFDLIGYPSERHLTDYIKFVQRGTGSEESLRDKWQYEVNNLRMKDIDSFLERLYDEYNQLLVEKPHLFVKG